MGPAHAREGAMALGQECCEHLGLNRQNGEGNQGIDNKDDPRLFKVV
jgi:hypothetical protein